MISLIQYAYRKLKPQKEERNFAILGLEGSGKTSLLNQFRTRFGLPSEEVLPTTGQTSLTVKHTHMRHRRRYHLIDLGGSRSIRSYWSRYLPDLDGIIYVIDASSFYANSDEVLTEISKILENPEVEGVPMVFCANKQDARDGAVSPEEIVDLMELGERVVGRPWKVVATAAGNGDDDDDREDDREEHGDDDDDTAGAIVTPSTDHDDTHDDGKWAVRRNSQRSGADSEAVERARKGFQEALDWLFEQIGTEEATTRARARTLQTHQSSSSVIAV